ncbi:MAG: ACP phosphodiesterase [Planctomycetota bacterium]
MPKTFVAPAAATRSGRGGVAATGRRADSAARLNFLAHLFLADEDAGSRVGNLLPDLHRGRLPEGLSPAVMAGVERHRRVDVFTDHHPVFERSRARLRPRHGRYSGVIVDVLYDHALTVRWADYHPQPLSTFIAESYELMKNYPGLIPPRVRAIIHIMSEQDWLGSYVTVDGIALTLRRLSARLRERFNREVDLATAVEELRDQYDGFLADFDAFFPELIAHVAAPGRNHVLPKAPGKPEE